MSIFESTSRAREQVAGRSRDRRIDKAAVADFIKAYGRPKLAPVTIVIAAYQEKDNIGAVVSSMPSRLCGLKASVLVIVDSEEDGTAAIVRRAGGLAVVTGVNRGQGAALRLGYFMAREYGSRYLITADGDGQSDPADLAGVLEPVVTGEADFVNGSRRLGTTYTTGIVRDAGVFVFSKLATVLTGTKVTDTANSVRAVRAELTGRLTLDEPQYQAPEMLLSVIMSGARYSERPVTVQARKSGSSKKGGNFAYGYGYGMVFLHTWWREKRSNRARPPSLDK